MKIVLIDFSGIGHACFHAMRYDKKISANQDPFCPERVKYWHYMMLYSVRNLVKTHKPHDVVVCCDSKDSWRYRFFPYYKAKRNSVKESYDFDYRTFIDEMLKFLDMMSRIFPYKFMKVNSTEADDILAILSKELHKEHEVIVCSNDKDMTQLIDKNVRVWNIRNAEWIECADVRKYLIEHVLMGDASDSVPNILSDSDTFITEGKRQKPCGSVKVGKILEYGLEKFISENHLEENFNRNKRLIQLDDMNIPKKIWDYVIDKYRGMERKKVDPMIILAYIRQSNFKGLENDIDGFIPIKEKQNITKLFQ